MVKKFNVKEFLTHIFLFNNFEKDELSAISKYCTVNRYKKNTILFSQGSDAEAFYIIVNGRTQVYRLSPSGDEQVIHINKDFDLVAEASIFDKGKYPANCKILKDSMIVKVPRNAFIETLIKNPESLLKVLASYSKRMRELVTQIEYLSIDDVKIRIVKYFQKNMITIDGVSTVKLKITKKELAGFLGTVPETISRNLTKLKKDGIISEKLGVFKIENMSLFKELLN